MAFIRIVILSFEAPFYTFVAWYMYSQFNQADFIVHIVTVHLLWKHFNSWGCQCSWETKFLVVRGDVHSRVIIKKCDWDTIYED
jgi:hypothetical protein